jgi:hypothetical protein
VKQYCKLDVAWQTLFASQQPEQVLEQLLLGASHRPETQVALGICVQSAHTAPVRPHALFAAPATQLSPWQQPLVQFWGLQVLVLPSGPPPPESTTVPVSVAASPVSFDVEESPSSSGCTVSAVASELPLASRPGFASPPVPASPGGSVELSSPPPSSPTYCPGSPPVAQATERLATRAAHAREDQDRKLITSPSYDGSGGLLPGQGMSRRE